jgi:hypothetical protein
MAISKTISTDYGVNITHHVTFDIDIYRGPEQLSFRLKGYPLASNFNNGNNALKDESYLFTFSSLPASVLAKIVELKDIIEQELINNLPEWAGGTRVNDDGTPI